MAAAAAPANIYDFRPIGINMWLDGTAVTSNRVNTIILRNVGNQRNIFPFNDTSVPPYIAAAAVVNNTTNPRTILKYQVDDSNLRVFQVPPGKIKFIPHTQAINSYITIGTTNFYIQGQTAGGMYGAVVQVSTDPSIQGNYTLKINFCRDDTDYRNSIKEGIINSIINQQYSAPPLCEYANEIYAISGKADINIPNPPYQNITYPYYVCMIQEKLYRTGNDMLITLNPAMPMYSRVLKNILYQLSAKLENLWADFEFNHVDLKTDNFMIDIDGNCKLIDFGFSRMDPFPANRIPIITNHGIFSTRSSSTRDLNQLLWDMWHYNNVANIPAGSLRDLFRVCLTNIPNLERRYTVHPLWRQGVDLRDPRTASNVAPGQSIRNIVAAPAMPIITNMFTYSSLFDFGNRYDNPNTRASIIRNQLEIDHGLYNAAVETYGINPACDAVPPIPALIPYVSPAAAVDPAAPGAMNMSGGRIQMKGLLLPYMYSQNNSTIVGGKRSNRSKRTKRTKRTKNLRTKKSRRQ